MKPIIELSFDEDPLIKEYYTTTDIFEGETVRLEGIKKVNLFIGQNNSGKSRLLRAIFKSFLPGKRNPAVFATIEDFTKEFNINLTKWTQDNNSKAELKAIFESRLKDCDYISNKQLEEITKGIEEAIKIYQQKKEGSFSKIINSLANFKHEFLEKNYSHIRHTPTYIPVLRSLFNIGGANTAQTFRIRIVSTYFKNLDAMNFIYTGEDFFKEVRYQLLSDYKSRRKIDSFEKFISRTFFKGEHTISLIPREHLDDLDDKNQYKKNEDETLFIKIGNEKEQNINHLGDGIQNIILLLYPLFKAQHDRHLLFIEEPENYLHPGFQRIFIETILNQEFPNTQVFITTHSNHFLDLFWEHNDRISIFNFQKELSDRNEEEKTPSFSIKNVTEIDSLVLDNLGVRNSSVFQSNCTIWVEGITDRLYIKKYLELYHKKKHNKTLFKEDIHYSFIEYAGSNLLHWDFSNLEAKEKIKAFFISRKIFLIVDADYDSNGKIADWKEDRNAQLLKDLKDSFFRLTSKEIENTLKPHIIEKIVQSYEKDTSIQLGITESKLPEYYNENLGKYINDALSKKYPNNKFRSYQKENTISDKLTFCHKALSFLTEEDLSEEIEELCELITNFIKKSNQ